MTRHDTSAITPPLHAKADIIDDNTDLVGAGWEAGGTPDGIVQIIPHTIC